MTGPQTAAIRQLTPPIDTVPLYIALTRMGRLADQTRTFSTALAKLKQQGAVQVILDHYLGSGG